MVRPAHILTKHLAIGVYLRWREKMNSMQIVRKYIEDNKIMGISGSIFKDHCTSTTKYRSNIDIDTFLVNKGEAWCSEFMNMVNAPTQRITGECKRCFRLLTENDLCTCKEESFILKEKEAEN